MCSSESACFEKSCCGVLKAYSAETENRVIPEATVASFNAADIMSECVCSRAGRDSGTPLRGIETTTMFGVLCEDELDRQMRSRKIFKKDKIFRRT